MAAKNCARAVVCATLMVHVTVQHLTEQTGLVIGVRRVEFRKYSMPVNTWRRCQNHDFPRLHLITAQRHGWRVRVLTIMGCMKQSWGAWNSQLVCMYSSCYCKIESHTLQVTPSNTLNLLIHSDVQGLCLVQAILHIFVRITLGRRCAASTIPPT